VAEQSLASRWIRRVFVYAPRRLLKNIAETLRLIAFALLRPAASFLPRSWALALADLVGAIVAASTAGRSARLGMELSFGQSADPARLARGWLTRPFTDYVIFRRILTGREGTGRWRIEHRGLEKCQVLFEPGQSVIVATGHFARHPIIALYFPEIIPKKLAAVVAALDHRSKDPTSLRLRLQFGQMMDVLKYVRHGDIELVEVGIPGAASRLLQSLQEPGNVVVMAVDPPWPTERPGSFERAFAGHLSQGYATGAARLSRLAQCPVVTCIPYLEDDGRIIFEWSEPIPPARPEDRGSDVRVTNRILDSIERAVGLRPTQYVLKIGHHRRWDPTSESWRPVEASPGRAGASDLVDTSP